MIKHLLVHLDHTPASPGRLEAALAAACGAQVTVPARRGSLNLNLP
jgi:hypothetical protein